MFGLFKKSPQATAPQESAESRLQFSKNLQAVTNKIHATNNLDEIMLDLSKDICDLFNCDRLTLYAVSKDRNFIYSKVKTGIESIKELVLPIDADSVAGYVAMSEKTVRIHDVYNEKELQKYSAELKFRREVDEMTSYRTKQMLAAPILNANSQSLLGVIQLLNNRDDDAFSETAEAGLKELCETLAIAFVQRAKAPPVPATSKYQPLVVDSVVTAAELEQAAQTARNQNIDIEEILINEFKVPLATIGQALAKSYNVVYETHKENRLKPGKLLERVDRGFAEKHNWVPIKDEHTGITILALDPDHVSRMPLVRKVFPYGSLFFRVTTRREFVQILDALYRPAPRRA